MHKDDEQIRKSLKGRIPKGWDRVRTGVAVVGDQFYNLASKGWCPVEFLGFEGDPAEDFAMLIRKKEQ
jgi:hypothetical protein